MTTTRYKGFCIFARPYQLRVTGHWSVSLEIERHGRRQSFSTTERCPTEAEAVVRCAAWGRRIIDGRVPGWSVDRLRGAPRLWSTITQMVTGAVRRSSSSAS